MRFLKGYINNYHEAKLVMHAVRLGMLEPVEARLDLEQRDSIESGSIFCFIEKEGGMKRWTDGKIWSPSKILGQFLLYKEVPRHLSKSALKKKSHKIRKISIFNEIDKHGLYKKTVSISYENIVYHIVSYFRPIFNKHSLLELPFFISLNRALVECPDLMSDKFIKRYSRIEVLIEKHKLLPMEIQYLIPKIDRVSLEKLSCIILSNRFRE